MLYVKSKAKGFCSVASRLNGCGDVGYCLARKEKRQIQGQDAEAREDEN